ncbi:hypothetical protein G6F22_018928 [Rhizopus arrhizus]|nr:hypothetical protein G6F22_018928 [Rhizopus arrhizus]
MHGDVIPAARAGQVPREFDGFARRQCGAGLWRVAVGIGIDTERARFGAGVMHRQPQGSAGSGIGGGDVQGRHRPGYRAPRAMAMEPVRPQHPQVVTAVIAGRQPFTFQPLAGFHGVAARGPGARRPGGGGGAAGHPRRQGGGGDPVHTVYR